MALGSNLDPREQELWLTAEELPKSPGHPFYQALQRFLLKAKFDEFCEELCLPFYSDKGRPSIPPGTYFRMLMIGYLEGIESERGIAWRCADSNSLRAFLLLGPQDRAPDHSSLGKIRQRLDLETHERVFLWVLELLKKHKLLKGKNLGVDASTMEANAAMRSIIRKDTGESYQEYLAGLAKESGIETPTREDLKRMDRKRKKKTSNDDWENPNDPDARISKLKDGRTKLAFKPEHTVDLDTQAVIAAEVHHANLGDTTTGPETLAVGCENLITLGFEPDELKTCVADKGYFKSEHLGDLQGTSIRTYIAEPKQKHRRKWRGRTKAQTEAKKEDQKAVYANRRRLRSGRGRKLSKLRTERVERSFAHMLDSGGMRKTHLRGKENVQKRYLLQAATHNLALLMRKVFGVGKPRAWTKAAARAAHEAIVAIRRVVWGWRAAARRITVRLSGSLDGTIGAAHVQALGMVA
jgi:transposase